MNSTQNERINQITSSTLIVGVDIAKFKHVARVQDYRGVEFGRPITFENNREGFAMFVSWFRKIATEQGFQDTVVGMEPTGHFWLNLAHFLREQRVTCTVVNPLHVKKSKELDELECKFEELEARLDELLGQIPQVKQLLAIKGIGRDSIAGFLAEIGDIEHYRHPKQIIKLAGLNLKENTSGKHKGQTKITKRGRKRLRALLFRVMMPLVAKNRAFKALHEHYTKRPDNPLKKMQSLIALCGKLVRILFGVLKKGHRYSEEKMLQDIPRFTEVSWGSLNSCFFIKDERK
ncbi:transposase [Paenibacillus arenilitoris]|nr:transposase [Paenibacillus arenilitoris]